MSYNSDNDFQGSNPDTPFHKRMRDDMSVRAVSYGFYKVATEPVHTPKCVRCNKELNGEAFKINGKLKCRECMSARI